MHVQKFHGIKNWATITGGENGESEDEFLGKSDSDDMFILNPLTTTLKVKKDYREKRARCKLPGYTSKTYIFGIKCETFLCLNKNKTALKYFTKTKSIQIVM